MCHFAGGKIQPAQRVIVVHIHTIKKAFDKGQTGKVALIDDPGASAIGRNAVDAVIAVKPGIVDRVIIDHR